MYLIKCLSLLVMLIEGVWNKQHKKSCFFVSLSKPKSRNTSKVCVHIAIHEREGFYTNGQNIFCKKTGKLGRIWRNYEAKK